jgi:hypothetical protein
MTWKKIRAEMRKSHTAGGRCDKFHVGLVTSQLDAQEQHPGDAISASSGVAGQMLTAFKSLSTVIALSALSVLILSCSQTPDPNDVVKRLPELPPELAANLTSTKINNVLMTKDPPPVKKGKPPEDNPERCVKEYAAYVVYPMTVCFPPELLTDSELLGVKAQADAPGWSPASQPGPRYYKLTKSDRLPSICRISGGPWYADAATIHDCDGLAVSHLGIVGAPQQFTVVWDGDISAVPPPFNPNSFSLKKDQPPCERC